MTLWHARDFYLGIKIVIVFNQGLPQLFDWVLTLVFVRSVRQSLKSFKKDLPARTGDACDTAPEDPEVQ